MKANNSRGRGREARGGASRASGRRARAPQLDRSRAPKKNARKLPSAAAMRKSSGSIFQSPMAATKKGDSDELDDALDLRGFRLQQALAAAGLGSRRQCEELIREGRVEVDGKIVSELGVRVRPNEQKIRVDGELLPKSKPVYVALNKPKNALCTNCDPQGRRLALDFIPPELGRLFPVGRLDQNSEGLLLLTHDGALAQRLMHPSYEVPKKYRVQVAGLVDYELVNALRRGVHIAEGIVQADEATIHSAHKLSSVLEITLTEGKNREIRRMLARLGHKVMHLQRVQIGAVKLGKLAPGQYRRLTSGEVAQLYRFAETPIDKRPGARRAEDDSRPALPPVELATLEAREAQKNDAREGKVKGIEKAPAKDAARESEVEGYRDAMRKVFKEPFFRAKEKDESGERREVRNARGKKLTRRAPRDEFREEFRAEERGEARRRARREFDDETRTIGVKKFSRDEDGSSRDRFNYDASSKGRGAKGAKGSKGSKGSKRPGGFDKERKGPRQPRQGRATRGGRGGR